MDKYNMKNMVFIKDLPSNIAEEAIVILKPNVKLKSLDLAETKKDVKNSKNKIEQNQKKYIISEAEMVVNNYLSKIENKKKTECKINKTIEKKYKTAKYLSIFLGIMLVISFLV